MARILYQARFQPVLTTSQTPEQVTESRWHQPLSEPKRLRALTTAAVVAAGLTWCPQPVPTVTPGQFQRPLSEPIRKRASLPEAVVLAPYVAPAAETITVDKWQRALSEPTRIKGVPAAQQTTDAFVKASPFEETVSLDRWLRALSEPVRVPPRLAAGAQPWLAFVKADPFPEATDAGKWFAPLGEPVVKARSSIATGSQQFTAFGQPEPLSATRWFVPLSEPVRIRPALLAAIQQSLALVKAAPFEEAVTVDRWLLALQEPQRQRVGLAARHQQFTALWPYPLPNIDAPAWVSVIYPDRAPGRSLATAAQQASAFVKAAPFEETVSADRWAQPIAQPTRRLVSVAGIPVTFAGPSLPVVASPDRWWSPLSLPVRRIGSVADQMAATAPALPTVSSPDRWLQAFAQPGFVKFRVPANQPGPLYVAPEVVTLDKWFHGLSEPQRQRLGLAARQQQTLALWPYPIPSENPYREFAAKIARMDARGSLAVLSPATPTLVTDSGPRPSRAS